MTRVAHSRLACRLQSGDMSSVSRTLTTGIGAPLAATLIGACSPPAVAPFSELDRDGDGRISQQEATQDVVLAGTFADFDIDEDGELTPFEYLQAANRR